VSAQLAEGIQARDLPGERDLDLDRTASPAPAGRTVAAAVAGVMLVAALAGAGVRGVLLGPAASQDTAVTARLVLRDVLLQPEPVAMLRLTVDGVTEARLTGLSVGGGGLSATLDDARALPPRAGGPATEVRARLRCKRRTDQTPVAAAIELHQAGTAIGVGEVVVVGRLSQAGGVCRTADERLPDGWQEPVPVSSARVSGDGLELRVRDLVSTDEVVGAVYGADLFAAREVGARAQDGTRTVRLDPPPERGCDHEAADLPAGVGLRIVGPAEQPRVRYAAVGPVLARWLAPLRAGACTGEGQGSQ
jgi:hypothetical protein